MSIEMIDSLALRKFQYGVFVQTTQADGRDNGCITNTVFQCSSEPYRIAVSSMKTNLTHDMIHKSGVFNLSVLSEAAPFSVFQHFGMQTGRNVDKFAGGKVERLKNGLAIAPEYANAVFSARVLTSVDNITHTLFVAEITEAHVLSDITSMTYDYYYANVKVKPNQQPKKGFICSICNHVYEGDVLPPDYICPICSHGAEYFNPIT